MPTRLNILPDQRLLDARPALQDYLSKIGQGVTPENFADLLDSVILGLLNDAFGRVAAHEGSIWVLDASREFLINSYNSGPNSSKIVGFRQPIREGIISMVVATEQGFVENEVYRNEKHSKLLDNELGMVTYAMIAVPFYFLSDCRGVISCVQLSRAKKENGQLIPIEPLPGGFDFDNLLPVQQAAAIIRDLLDLRMMRSAFGFE
jgi:hypothetical protein